MSAFYRAFLQADLQRCSSTRKAGY